MNCLSLRSRSVHARVLKKSWNCLVSSVLPSFIILITFLFYCILSHDRDREWESLRSPPPYHTSVTCSSRHQYHIGNIALVILDIELKLPLQPSRPRRGDTAQETAGYSFPNIAQHVASGRCHPGRTPVPYYRDGTRDRE